VHSLALISVMLLSQRPQRAEVERMHAGEHSRVGQN